MEAAKTPCQSRHFSFLSSPLQVSSVDFESANKRAVYVSGGMEQWRLGNVQWCDFTSFWTIVTVQCIWSNCNIRKAISPKLRLLLFFIFVSTRLLISVEQSAIPRGGGGGVIWMTVCSFFSLQWRDLRRYVASSSATAALFGYGMCVFTERLCFSQEKHKKTKEEKKAHSVVQSKIGRTIASKSRRKVAV